MSWLPRSTGKRPLCEVLECPSFCLLLVSYRRYYPLMALKTKYLMHCLFLVAVGLMPFIHGRRNKSQNTDIHCGMIASSKSPLDGWM